jgi:hypothetical protein
MIRKKVKISAQESVGCYEMKHKPWFIKGSSKLFDLWKQGKLQWLQDTRKINGVNLNNERHEDSRNFRNKKKEYLKENINELGTNRKNKNIRDLYGGINEFKRVYQPRSNLVEYEKGCTVPQHFKWVKEILLLVTECA